MSGKKKALKKSEMKRRREDNVEEEKRRQRRGEEERTLERRSSLRSDLFLYERTPAGLVWSECLWHMSHGSHIIENEDVSFFFKNQALESCYDTPPSRAQPMLSIPPVRPLLSPSATCPERAPWTPRPRSRRELSSPMTDGMLSFSLLSETLIDLSLVFFSSN